MNFKESLIVNTSEKKNNYLSKSLYKKFMILFIVFFFIASPIASARKIKKILFIGNSITAHGIAKHLNWHGYWGMAASTRQKDFVHQAYKRIAAYQGFKPEIYISGRDTGTAGKITNALKVIDQLKKIEADLIIVQLGENERCSNKVFIENYSKLINELKQIKTKPIIACVGTWNTINRREPIKKVAKETGSIFINTAKISGGGRNSAKDKKYFPPGVQWHPGDSGMRLYGIAIFKTLKPVLSRGNKKKTNKNSDQKLTGIVPEPKEFYNNGTENFKIKRTTVLMVDVDRGKLVDRGVTLLKEDFKKLYNIDLQVKYETLNRGGNAVMLVNDAKDFKSTLAGMVAKVRQLSLRNDEGYVLASGSDSVFVEALTPAGTLYGIQTLRQMLTLDRNIIPGLISDFPSQEKRVVYLGMPYYPEWIVRKMARMKINLCIVESRWNGKGNWWYNSTGKNLENAKSFMKLCKEYGIEVAPLVQGLGWAYGVIDKNPNCAEGIWIKNAKITLPANAPALFPHRNLLITEKSPIIITHKNGRDIYKEGKDYQLIHGVSKRPFSDSNTPWKIKRLPQGRIKPGQVVLANYNYMNLSRLQSPYCPSEPESYKIVDQVLTDVVKKFKPKYIHIGHDEVIYKCRDSRCLQSGKSVEQLMGEDIKRWCAKLKKLDPNIKIMIWDDLLRPGKFGDKVLTYVPKDVIICPWEYRVSPDAKDRIGNLLDWFIVKKQRPVMGTTSDYFMNNALDWKNACSKFKENKKCRGFMFADWGRDWTLWGKLSFNANYMWSYKTLNDSSLLVNINSYFRQRYGLELSLAFDFYKQKKWLANSVNRVLISGQDGKAFDLQSKKFKAKLAKYYYPSFARNDLAVGTFPENAMTQLNRFAKLYRAMYLYGVSLAGKNYHIEEVLELIKTVEPARSKEFELHLGQWQQDKKLPSGKKLFGIKIEPLSPIKMSGLALAVNGVKTLSTSKNETVYDLGRELMLCRARFLESDTYRFAVSKDGKTYNKVSAQAIGNAYVWEPMTGRYIKIIGVAPVKLQLYAMKSQTSVICPTKRSGSWRKASFWEKVPRNSVFTTPFGTISNTSASAAMANDSKNLYFNFKMQAKVNENNKVKVIFSHPIENPAFFEITAEQKGKIVASRHGYENKRNNDLIVVNKNNNGFWSCSFAVPLSWLEVKTNEIDKATVNFLIKTPNQRDFNSWLLLPPNAKYWFNQQPFGKIEMGSILR